MPASPLLDAVDNLGELTPPGMPGVNFMGGDPRWAPIQQRIDQQRRNEEAVRQHLLAQQALQDAEDYGKWADAMGYTTGGGTVGGTPYMTPKGKGGAKASSTAGAAPAPSTAGAAPAPSTAGAAPAPSAAQAAQDLQAARTAPWEREALKAYR